MNINLDLSDISPVTADYRSAVDNEIEGVSPKLVHHKEEGILRIIGVSIERRSFQGNSGLTGEEERILIEGERVSDGAVCEVRPKEVCEASELERALVELIE